MVSPEPAIPIPRKGMVIDTNILLLLFVGIVDRSLVEKFKRTQQFSRDDFDLLRRLLSNCRNIITTPNILTEVNSLVGQLNEPYRSKCLKEIASIMKVLSEEYVSSRHASIHDCYLRLGLTDATIAHIAETGLQVLTDDVDLYIFLAKAGIPVINFNHLRGADWFSGQ